MTTSATSSFELNRDALIRRSYQVAGLLEASQSTEGSDITLAADLLQMELTAMVADGSILTWMTGRRRPWWPGPPSTRSAISWTST